ncbi:MAG: cytochrome c556 [Pseudohongiellaceae bacterium]|jgi:cytochrome c556
MQTFKTAVIALVLGSVFSCSAPPEDNSPVAMTEQFNTTLDMKQLMSLVLEPAADTLWDSGGWVLDSAGYEELYPTTEEGWAFVRAQAAVIVETGNMLALPGRAEDNDAWMIYSQGLSEAGINAMTAAAAQNEEDFFQAGAQLYSVCTACHQAYNPDIVSKFAE